MKISKLLSAALIAASSLSFSSCSNGNDAQDSYNAIVFVNYEGINEGYHVFKYTEPNTDESINILSQGNFNDTPPALGTRVIGVFNVPYNIQIQNNMTLDCVGIGKLNASGTLTSETFSGGVSFGAQFYLTSVSRAGDYIDITGLASAEKSKMRLVADASTMQNEKPTLYLIYELEAPETIGNGQYFASFDISQITQNPMYTGFTLIINNSNSNGVSNFDFSL